MSIDPDTLVKSDNVDGLAWAESFTERFAGHCVSDDPDLAVERVGTDDVHGWFANAIENGKNHQARRLDPQTSGEAIELVSTLAINAVIKGADPEDLLDSVRTAVEWAAEERAAVEQARALRAGHKQRNPEGSR